MLLITKSRVSVFNACRRMHDLQYVKGYRSVEQHATAEFGTLFHVGLEHWWKTWQAGVMNRDRDAPLNAALGEMSCHVADRDIDEASMAKATLLMMAYHARWSADMADLEVVAVEREFSTPVRNPANGAICRKMRSAGKIDVIVRRISTGEVWNVEHKTSGADLSAGSTYWNRLRMDPQVSTYHRGSQSLGYEPVGTIYDVIVRPDERPLKATPVEKRKYTIATATKPSRLYANQRDTDETIDEFKARMAKAIMDEPEMYLARAEVVRLDSELEAFDRDNYETAMEIRESSRTGRAPRNADACFRFNRPCDFLPVCSGVASIDDETLYRKSTDVHPELSGVVTINPKEKGNDNGNDSSRSETNTAEGGGKTGHGSEAERASA